VPFIPTSPQNPAGMRIEPPPSPPVATGSSPRATTAADPPDDPPAVRPCSQGLWVTPCSRDTLTLRPPNSLAVVWPTFTAPAASSRWTIVADRSATRSANTRLAAVSGQPATGCNSLIPSGTPPKGRPTSAAAAAASAPGASTNGTAFSELASMAASTARVSSVG
jgi:hypothetical protein